mmetsp:Transcript_846/g.1145  ORF Transcript_846/g.1145 Transcript_846/m.1145 type:complete len:2346 (+) Transcript_846:80-7117(+)
MKSTRRNMDVKELDVESAFSQIVDFNTLQEKEFRTLRNWRTAIWILLLCSIVGLLTVATQPEEVTESVLWAFVGLTGLLLILLIIFRVIIQRHMETHSLEDTNAWRNLIQAVIYIRSDRTNRLRLSRALQVSVPQLSPNEGYLLDRFIAALDDENENLSFHMERAFRVRNVGRIIVQALPLFDILWHNSTRLEYIRILDFLNNFPATENDKATVANACALIFRQFCVKGNCCTRYFTANRSDLTLDGNVAASNLAVGNAFESVSRATHGVVLGREKNVDFRNHNRLPADESIVRNFFANPSQTIADNGFEHVMRAVVKHWQYTLSNRTGNFAHQRQELLDPVWALRFLIPEVLTQLIALRGINNRDNKVVACYIDKLQLIKPEFGYRNILKLLVELQQKIAPHICGGVPCRIAPLQTWIKLLIKSVNILAKEAKLVLELIDPARQGIMLGIQVIENSLQHRFPTKKEMNESINDYLNNRRSTIPSEVIESALEKLNPKDKRTFLEFFNKDLPRDVSIFRLLKRRVRVLLKREFLRFTFNKEIEKLQKNEEKAQVALEINEAQKRWMRFELDFLKRFSIASYLDHMGLRTPLRHLQIVSQMQCTVLDHAKIQDLERAIEQERVSRQEDLVAGKSYWFKASLPHGKVKKFVFKKKDEKMCTFESEGNIFSIPWDTKRCIFTRQPQNTHIVGGGPSGLLTALNVNESVLRTGGTLSVSEKRDAFRNHGSAFQRAQVVRLDPRWVAMIRYHTGTRFEDVFVPLDGETMAHSSNFLVDMGFVELTTKQLEDVLLVAVIQRRAAGLLDYHTESTIDYDWKEKQGYKTVKHLKRNDRLSNFLDTKTNTMYQYAVVTDIKKEKKTSTLHLCCFNDNKSTNIAVNVACNVKYNLDLDNTHIVMATGKGANSHDQFRVSTYENYGVVCCAGAKVSQIMHNMGNPRWKGILINDIRTILEENTRLIGDFTKVVSTSHIAEFMIENVNKDDWRVSLTMQLKLKAATSAFKTFYAKIIETVRQYYVESEFHVRTHLQLRVFETGDNSYVGMEVPREFQYMQQNLTNGIIKQYYPKLECKLKYRDFEHIVLKFTAKLFFQGALNVLHTGDVFLPGAKNKIQSYRLIDSALSCPLSNLKKGEAFNLLADDTKTQVFPSKIKSVRCEVISAGNGPSRWQKARPYIIRDMEGHVFELSSKVKVYRASDLTRAPDGVQESKVAFATFPVAHYVNRSVARLLKDDFLYIPVGDAQSTPHFMRYSGLTGAGINAMELDNYFRAYLRGESFENRYKEYCVQTNRSNHEVVTRGIGFGYGEDGFLRPGFKYQEFIEYVFSKIDELIATGVEMKNVNPKTLFTSNWKKKFASSLVPRKLENHKRFIKALKASFNAELKTYVENLQASKEDAKDLSNMKIVQDQKMMKDFEIVNTKDAKVVDETEESKVTEESKMKEDVKRKYVKMEDVKDEKTSITKISVMKESISEMKGSLSKFSVLSGMKDSKTLEEFTSKRGSQASLDTMKSSRTSVTEPSIKFKSKSLETKTVLVRKVFRVIINFASEEAKSYLRISSEASNQPKPLDSIVDNQGPEAQDFINGFTLAAAFTALGLAAAQNGISLLGVSLSTIFGGIISPILAFISIANASRYLRRNEDFQRKFKDNNLNGVKRALCSMKDVMKDDMLAPFLSELRNKFEKVQKLAKYDNKPLESAFVKSVTKLLELEERKPKRTLKIVKAILNEIITHLIPDVYHEFTYTKDAMAELVDELEGLQQVIKLSIENKKKVKQRSEEDILDQTIQYIDEWEENVRKCIEDGAVKLGLFRLRHLRNSHFVRVLLFLRNLIPFGPCQTLARKTKNIIYNLRTLNQLSGQNLNTFDRIIRDLDEFYYATVEIYKVNLLLVSGTIAALASILKSALIIHGTAEAGRASGFALAIVGPIPSIIALVFLIKFQTIISKTKTVCGINVCSYDGIAKLLREQINSGKHKGVTKKTLDDSQEILRVQSRINILRIIASASAAMALVCTMAMPVWVALVATISLVASFVAIFGSLYVLYALYYNLDERMPALICKAFDDQIMEIYHALLKSGRTDTALLDNRSAWEYTARGFLHLYRFDQIFDPPRLNSILQYIQSGLALHNSRTGLPPPRARAGELKIGKQYELLIDGIYTGCVYEGLDDDGNHIFTPVAARDSKSVLDQSQTSAASTYVSYSTGKVRTMTFQSAVEAPPQAYDTSDDEDSDSERKTPRLQNIVIADRKSLGDKKSQVPDQKSFDLSLGRISAVVDMPNDVDIKTPEHSVSKIIRRARGWRPASSTARVSQSMATQSNSVVLRPEQIVPERKSMEMKSMEMKSMERQPAKIQNSSRSESQKKPPA